MKTLIELYDERPLDNVLSTEMFRPETTVFLCPPEVEEDRTLRDSLKEYFKNRGCRTDIRSYDSIRMQYPRRHLKAFRRSSTYPI